MEAQSARILGVLDQLGIGHTHLLGCSMGGAICLWLRKRFPDRFGDIVCIAPATNPQLVPLRVAGLEPFARAFGFVLNRTTMRWILKRVLANHALVDDRTIDAYLAPYLSNGESIRTFLKATELLRDSRLPRVFCDLGTRTALLWGRRDRIVPGKYIQELRQTIPNSRYREHPWGGHHLMEDDPEWVLGQINDFFGIVEPRGVSEAGSRAEP